MSRRPSSRPTAKQNHGTPERRFPWLHVLVAATSAATLTASVCLSGKGRTDAVAPVPERKATAAPAVSAAVGALLVPAPLPADADPGLLNLLCAPDVSEDASGRKLAANLKTLDDWAAHIAWQTSRNLHRFRENPEDFGTEPEWRLAMMCTVLGQDLKVRYDPALSTPAMLASPNEVFFARSAPAFLSGCLGPDRAGTCSSLPVLYVALGRRLGYPMHLVAAKSHLFARWDDGKGTRVNLEAANGGGFSSQPDSYYRAWPRPISPEEEEKGGYLRNLDASEMLAVFLDIRADCLKAAGRPVEAVRAAAVAYNLAPTLGGVGECLMAMLPGRARPLVVQSRPIELDFPHPGLPGLPPDPTPRVPQPWAPNVFQPATPGFPSPDAAPRPGVPGRTGYPNMTP